MVLGKLYRYVQKNETRPPSYTTHKNKLKMGKILKYKLQNHKNLEENVGSKISDILHSNIFADISPRQGKQKNKQMGLHQTKSLAQQWKPSIKLKHNPWNWRTYSPIHPVRG